MMSPQAGEGDTVGWGVTKPLRLQSHHVIEFFCSLASLPRLTFLPLPFPPSQPLPISLPP